jgi:hypothetical protein
MRARVAIVIILGVILIAAGVSFYLSSTATGTLAVQVHDAPSTWSNLTVTFSEVAVHRADAANDSGWIVLRLAVTQIDLLAPGNLSHLLALDRVAPGTYTQLRIVVTAVRGVLSGGPAVTLSVPDGLLKTAIPFVLRGGRTTTLNVDLDLGRSIHEANGIWIFSPVVGQVIVS